MSALPDLAVIAVCIVFSAVFAGSESGLYSLSRARLDLAASRGSWSARLLLRLIERDASVLITILIGNNLVLEIATHRTEALVAQTGIDERWTFLAITLTLSPIVFFFGEVLPKDLYRRRPHKLMRPSAALLVVAGIVFWPIERVLRGLSWLGERTLGLSPQEVARGTSRAEVISLLEEGTRVGTLAADAEALARNALGLRAIPVARAMMPWSRVQCVRLGEGRERVLRAADASEHTRLPALGADGEVLGYLHQLDLLTAGPDVAPETLLRDLLFLEHDTPIPRALARLRSTRQRAAVVGTPERPEGFLTLPDLLEEISGDLGGW